MSDHEHISDQDPDDEKDMDAVLGEFAGTHTLSNTGAVVIAYAWPTRPSATPQEVKAQVDLVVEKINRNWHETLKHEMPPRAVMVDQETRPFLAIIDQVRVMAAQWIAAKRRRDQEQGGEPDMGDVEIETFVRRALSMGDQVIMPPTMPALSSLIVQVMLADAIDQHGPLELTSDVVEKIAEYFRDQRAPQFVIEQHPNGYVVAVKADQETP